ncbi:hypothetical protein PT2222_320038 [Paraburkholderia tropica]
MCQPDWEGGIRSAAQARAHFSFPSKALRCASEFVIECMKANLKLMAEGALWKVSCSGATLRAHDAQTAAAMCRTLQTRGEPIPGKTYRHFTLQSELIAGLSCARFVAHKMRRLSVVCKRALECARPPFPIR